MALSKSVIQTRTLLTNTAMNSLGSGTYVVLGTVNFSTNDPVSCFLEVTVTAPAAVASLKQVAVYLQGSLDGTNFETGPTSGTVATDEPVLTFLGTVPCPTNSQPQTKIFNIKSAFDDIPHSAKVIAKNETGAVLPASGHSAYYAEIIGDVT